MLSGKVTHLEDEMRFRRFFPKLIMLTVLIGLCSISGAVEPKDDNDHDKDHGHNTCHTSPENPSLILALVGTAGVAWQYLRTRARRRPS